MCLNKDFEFKPLMREQHSVHNIITWECCCWKNTNEGQGVRCSPVVQNNALFTKY